MKKIVLLVCSILLAVFLILDFRYGASSQVTFLGLKTMEPEELERLIKEEQAYEMEEKPELNLTFNGVSVPFEYEHSRYYLPLEAGNPEWENESLTSQFANENGELFFVADGDWLPDKQLSISNGTEYNLVYLSETGYSVYSIVFTAFPMITITTYDDVAEEEEPVTALEKLVEFQLYESGKLGQYSNYIQESAAYIRVRGNASQWLDKKSYKVTLLPERKSF